MTKQISKGKYNLFLELTEQLIAFKSSARIFEELYKNSLETIMEEGKIHLFRYIPLNWPSKFKATGEFNGTSEEDKKISLEYLISGDKKILKSNLKINLPEKPIILELLKECNTSDIGSYTKNEIKIKKIDNIKNGIVREIECFGIPYKLIIKSNKESEIIKY